MCKVLAGRWSVRAGACGSNDEAPYLSRKERMKVIKTVVDEVNAKVRLSLEQVA
jgi:dihydrodipicolinate synthase/N-acetylneuraminate lyase